MYWAPPVAILLTVMLATGCDQPDENPEDPADDLTDDTPTPDTDSNSDTDTDTDEIRDDDDAGCEEVTLDIKGPTSPKVGDEWVIIMRCDNAFIQGPTVIRFTPPGFANSAENVVLFTTSGDAMMRVQVGVYRVETDIVVRP